MKKPVTLIIACLLLACLAGSAQRITYSEPDKDDARTLNFEIVGKLNGNVMVYKNYRDLHFMVTYNNEMQVIDKVKLNFLDYRVLNSEFVQYPDFVYMIYQYQKRSIMYCMAVKLDAGGKKIGDPVELDSTDNINYSANNKIYSVINSEDKQKLMIFKINTKNDKAHVLTTCLFDKELKLIKKSRLSINMPQRNDFLSEFSLDNDGDLVCVRASGTASNDNINKISLLTKQAMRDSYTLTDLKVTSIFLDDLRIKVDNVNKHYVLTSFLSKAKRGNIEGLYYVLWDKAQNKELLNATTMFTDEFREDARGEGNMKTAFNDYFLKNIILRRDGGFIVVSESAYTSSRGNTLNRWDYLYGSPYWSPVDYYTWNSPIGYYPWYRSNLYNNSNMMNRYFADNIAIISFEPNGKMEWSNVMRKAQFDDNTDNYIGFGLFNTGDQLHFIFNVQEKRTMILSDQSVSPTGQVDRNPTFKNLDKGYDFMPRHAKQVGARQAIVPCQYRGFTCFAKVEF
ncbi:MAG: hypothetical protein V4539_07480 [Bacteroidota bacterium]